MKKSLKKVISAIAALALSTSSFVALAANFPDVADTADYAKAVDQLTAMGIVDGYEDGTFQPDKSVTRAEMTKMIISALGSKNAAESMSGRDTAFKDVDHNHWAAGYVAVANTTNPQFIQGMGDGTFAPDATVTYEQAVTMLVRAVGYETLASQQGYPNGYLSQAAVLGITNGVVVPNGTELNRGQVAILIDNAVVDAPILGEGTWQTNYLNGTGGYTPEVKDGTNPYLRNFWTTLATKQNVYKVYGMVVGTKQSGATNDAKEVRFEVQRAENFDGMSYGFTFAQSVEKTMDVGDTDAADYLNQYAEVLVKKLGDEDYVILSYTAGGGRTAEEVYSADRYSSSALDSSISFLDENGRNARSRRLSPNVKYYVNDYPIDIVAAPTADNQDTWAHFVQTYFVDNHVGEIKLVDYKSETIGANGVVTNVEYGSDGKFDSVMVTYYQDAIVDEVVVSSAGDINIRFLDQDTTLGASNLTIDPEDDDRIVKFQGDADSYEDIEQYDVLSIQKQPGTALEDCEGVVVTVARNAETGTVTRTGTDDLTNQPLYYIGDGSYVVNQAMGVQNLETSSEYTIYLDAFGYIVYAEEGVNSKDYAVIDRMYVAEGGSSYKIKLITADGRADVYDYYRQNTDSFLSDARTYAYTTANSTVDLQNDGNRKPVDQRVVTYTVTTSGQLRITGRPHDKASDVQAAVEQPYQLSSNRIGSVRLGDNSTVLDLTEYMPDDYNPNSNPQLSYEDTSKESGEVSVMGSLQPDTVYTAYGYGRSATDSTYRFVIVTKGAGGISLESPFAVISSISTSDYGDGNTTQLTVYTNGELTDLLLDIDADPAATALLTPRTNASLSAGDAFIYELGVDNRIKKAQMIYDMPTSANYNANSYGAYVNTVFNAAEADATTVANAGGTYADYATAFDAVIEAGAPTAATYTGMNNFYKNRGDYAYFAFGPVLNTTGGVTLATLENTQVAGANAPKWISYVDKGIDYSYDTEYYIYTYDWGTRGQSDRVKDGSRGSIQRTEVPRNLVTYTWTDGTTGSDGQNGTYIDWTDANNYNVHGGNVTTTNTYSQSSISFALLKIYNGDIAVGYSILPATKN